MVDISLLLSTFKMFSYANPYDFEPILAEGDQVNSMDIVLDVVDVFGGDDEKADSWHLNSISPLYNLHNYVLRY